MGRPALDLKGKRFNALEALEKVRINRRIVMWRCLCHACGNDKYLAHPSNLASGELKSCGCQRGVVCRERSLTHGMTGTPTYNSWVALRDRCTNPAKEGYYRYGGRGITYDPRWGVFENFLADMGVCPDGMELDREDNSKGYFKDNCRWVTHKVNCNNRG